MTFGESLVRCSAIRAIPWLMMLCSKLARKPPYPMFLVAQHRTGVAGIGKLVAVITLHVYGRSPRYPLAISFAHPSRNVAELIVVTGRDL